MAEVRIGPAAVSFDVEVAQSATQQRMGLKGRGSVAPGTGMLFQYDNRVTRQVQMTNINVALDVAWIADGHIVGVDTIALCTRRLQARCPRWTSPDTVDTVDTVLEVPTPGLRNITPGMSINIQRKP